MIRIRNRWCYLALFHIRRFIKRRCHHSLQLVADLLMTLVADLRNLQLSPISRKRQLNRTVHCGFCQDLPNLCDTHTLRFHAHAVSIFIKRLALSIRTHNVKIDRAVLLGIRKILVTAGTQSTTHNLLNAAHIPPRIQDMNLTNEAKVNSLSSKRACDDNLHVLPRYVCAVLHCAQHHRDFYVGCLRRDQNVLALRRSLVAGLLHQTPSLERSKSVLFQRHRKQTSSAFYIV